MVVVVVVVMKSIKSVIYFCRLIISILSFRAVIDLPFQHWMLFNNLQAIWLRAIENPSEALPGGVNRLSDLLRKVRSSHNNPPRLVVRVVLVMVVRQSLDAMLQSFTQSIVQSKAMRPFKQLFAICQVTAKP